MYLVDPRAFLRGVFFKKAILLMSCLALSIVLLILFVGRAWRVQYYLSPNPRRRRVPCVIELFLHILIVARHTG